MNWLTVLKWAAIAFMTIDHVGAAWYGRMYPLTYDIGRLAMPIFAGLLAFNLARPGAMERGVYRRVMVRLIAFGLLAYPFHVLALGQGWHTLNIMFVFACGLASIWTVERAGTWTVPLLALWLLVVPLFLEFHWAGPSLLLALWLVFRRARFAWYALGAAMAILCVENGNVWTLAALPLLWPLLREPVYPDRSRWASWAFYAYYPVHLAVLVLLPADVNCGI